jgi:FkbH-like protein
MKVSFERNAREILADPESSLAQLQLALTAIETAATAGGDERVRAVLRIGVSSNVTVDLLAVYLKRYGWMHAIPIAVEQGNFDDPVGDMERFASAGLDYAILLPFFDQLLPGFEAQLATFTEEQLAARETALRTSFRLAFERGAKLKRIFVCGLHGFSRPASNGLVAATLSRFNDGLREELACFHNVCWIDMQELVNDPGREAAFDMRFYFRASAPYKPLLLDRLAERVCRLTRGFGSYYYKVLVLDCDNTLWGGILGEVLADGIELDPYTYPGNIFWRVQHQLLTLERNGVLLCLCSRNNPSDVDEVLRTHPQMVLKEAHFVSSKVNWRDKVDNLRELASELNLGLDSFVLLDDSSFELAAVRAQLPMVHTVLVPPSLPDYPAVVETLADLFLAADPAAEGPSKTTQYRQQALSKDLERASDTREAYLASLHLKLEVLRNPVAAVRRMSELAHKSNQFNLTTRRYSESDLMVLMSDSHSSVYSFRVSDVFGDAGLTGMAVVRFACQTMTVEAYLFSCRVLGRGLEFAAWPAMIRDASRAGMTTLAAAFHATLKNAQVAGFYDQLGLHLMQESEGSRFYQGELASVSPPLTPWIEVHYA